MIYVTVGNTTQPFVRLVDAMDDYTLHANESVFIQVTQLSRKLHQLCIHEASVVVCHAGAGTLLQCWEAKKVPVVVPRRKKYDEHVDDHQYELTRALEPYYMIVPVYNTNDLASAIKKAKTMILPDMPDDMLIGALGDQIAGALKEM